MRTFGKTISAISIGLALGAGVGFGVVDRAAVDEPQKPAKRVATFADWSKAKIADLPAGSTYTQDGSDLMHKLNDEYHVPALFDGNRIIGNGSAVKITDPNRVVGVVVRKKQ